MYLTILKILNMGDDNYKERDDLRLFLTQINRICVSTIPKHSITFEIYHPFDQTEQVLRFNKGLLTFNDVHYSALGITIDLNEFMEFHRSAVVDNTELLEKIKHQHFNTGDLKHYWFQADTGKGIVEWDIVCKGHELKLENDPKPLAELD